MSGRSEQLMPHLKTRDDAHQLGGLVMDFALGASIVKRVRQNVQCALHQHKSIPHVSGQIIILSVWHVISVISGGMFRRLSSRVNGGVA